MQDNTNELKRISDKINQLKAEIKKLNNERRVIIDNTNKDSMEINIGDYVRIITVNSMSVMKVSKVYMNGPIRDIYGYTVTQKSDSFQMITNGCFVHKVDNGSDDITIEKITKADFLLISNGIFYNAEKQRDHMISM